MAKIDRCLHTNKATELIANAIADNTTIQFTRMEVSEQDLTSLSDEELRAITNLQLVNQIAQTGNTILADVDTVKVFYAIDNKNITTDYNMCTFAIYAKDSANEEHLYMIATMEEPDLMPSYDGINVYNMTEEFVTIVGNVDNVTVEVNNLGMVTVGMLQAIEITGVNGLIGGGSIDQSREIEPIYGTQEKTVLEGIKLCESLGIEYKGSLNNSLTKKAGFAYYDTATTSIYKCLADNNKNYADASFYVAISNDDLLIKLQNLGCSLIQYGAVATKIISVGATELITVTFPKSFATPPIVTASIGTSVIIPGTSHENDKEYVSVYTPTTTQVRFRWTNVSQSETNGRRIQWIAVGN